MAQGAAQAPAFPGIGPKNESRAKFFMAQRLGAAANVVSCVWR